MGTKNQPGAFDAYAKAEPDEPMFVLLARDAAAPQMVRAWAWLRRRQIREGKKPGEDEEMVAEAMQCAEAMEAWRRKRRGRA